MKLFTLIEADRYIKVDDKGIFFSKENWPFNDIEHLWAIQWKNGSGWVEYDTAIPHTPITEKDIEKYVNHFNIENDVVKEMGMTEQGDYTYKIQEYGKNDSNKNAVMVAERCGFPSDVLYFAETLLLNN